MLPLARYTSIGGVPLTALMDETQVDAGDRGTRRVAIDVISKKGATVDAPANGIVRMVKAIAWDRKEVLPASAFLEGEYGVNGLCIGVPLVLGANGVERILDLDLDEKEKAQFSKGRRPSRRASTGQSLAAGLLPKEERCRTGVFDGMSNSSPPRCFSPQYFYGRHVAGERHCLS